MKLSDMWGKSPTYHFNSLHIIMSKVYYRRRIVDIRASIIREKDAKKRDNEYYALPHQRQVTEEVKYLLLHHMIAE